MQSSIKEIGMYKVKKDVSQVRKLFQILVEMKQYSCKFLIQI